MDLTDSQFTLRRDTTREDPDHPNKVYKVVKALYGLHQAPRAWYETLVNYMLGNRFKRGKIDQTLFIQKQKGDILLVQVTQKEDEIFISQDKYVAKILKKFNYTNVNSAFTSVDLEKPLVKDGDADDVDVHLYRSMIRSLMYLTSSRPDIMFAVCACARFRVTPKISYLLAIKRIFRYLKDKPTLGLWYSRDSPFELCKKQTVVAISTTEAEYVAAASCCRQVLWIQNQLLDYGYNFMNIVINIDNNNLLTKGFDAGRHIKRGRDTKIPQSSGPPINVGDEAVHKELGDKMERAATTASSLEAEHDNVADEATFTSVDVDAGGAATTGISLDAGQGSGTIHKTPTRPHDSPLPRVHTLESDEGSLQQNELMDLVTKLNDRFKVLENDMQQTKKVYSSALTKLILRVKKLEKKVKTNKARRRARIVISEDKDVEEDSSKQGRKISHIDKDLTISFVHPEQDMEYDFDVSTAEGFTTASVPVTTTSATSEKKTKKQLEQERLGHEEAIRLQEQINEEENQRIARDAEIAKQLQEGFGRARQEQEVLAKADQAHDIDWSDPAVLRYHALQNRSFSKAEVRKNMCMYLKNQGGYKQSHFKGMSYEDIRPIFERVWDLNNAFFPKDFEIEKEKHKLEDDAKKKEIRDSMDVVPRDDIAIDVESLATKYPIVDWKTHVLKENMMYYQIIRADGSSKNYKIFSEMLDDFDRQDVMDLHRLC
ncbi:putative ribonuclease H-like domain-containing protein [Tanacetum coccineum]|uniref:Ribonuclease H-like domain-containing protein n=1 Tax=Tanacetum coccineum TaxID=301880 RepID=A0ABQ5A6G0_9ASTR